MNINPELKKMKMHLGTDKKVPVTIMLPPSVLRIIDTACDDQRASRGDLLGACFLRVNDSYKSGENKNFDPAAHAKKIWGGFLPDDK